MDENQILQQDLSQLKMLEWAKNHICMNQWIQRNVKGRSFEIFDQVASTGP